MHHDFLTSSQQLFFVSSPCQKPPMNRHLTYRPQTAQTPADSLRGGSCDPRDPRRFPRDPWRSMNPLTGICPACATVSGYRDASPNGERHHPAIVHCSLYIVHWSCFGSRYYSSDLSIWMSVDPMASKYPHQSNYAYCSNNPIKVVDPDGEDEWEVNQSGYIRHIENNKPDRLYAVWFWGRRMGETKNECRTS